MSRHRRSSMIVVKLLGLMLISGGYFMFLSNASTGANRALVEHPLFPFSLVMSGEAFLRIFAMFTAFCGALSMVLLRPRFKVLLVLSSPVMVYVSYVFLGLRWGIITSPQGVVFYGFLYMMMVVMYWGYDERS